MEKSITQKNLVFNKIKTEKFKPNPQNEEFFKGIEDAINSFKKKAASLQMGSVFYNDFNTRIDFLQNEIKDYIMSRDLEKQDLIKAVQAGSTFTSNMNFSCIKIFKIY